MSMAEKWLYENGGSRICCHELKNDRPPLVLLHAQGVDSTSFDGVWAQLAKKYHVYALDCFGHGGSSHDPEKYTVQAIGDAVIGFIENAVGQPVYLLGHSSGGLIAAYAASKSGCCRRLVLEDPPFFSSQGERRKLTYNYLDLSTVCHEFLAQDTERDFVLYYFSHQRAWEFFPEKSREKTRAKMIDLAAKYRRSHPGQGLKVPFWPKNALAGFRGMDGYDPRFGEAFYDDSFHAGIPHEQLLSGIKCPALFMKARTNLSPDGVLLAALGEDDLGRAASLIPDCTVSRFDCGHGIHGEKPRDFVRAICDFDK